MMMKITVNTADGEEREMMDETENVREWLDENYPDGEWSSAVVTIVNEKAKVT